MATEFSREFFSANRIVKADLRAARQPREDDITRIKAEVKKLYDATEVLLNITVDESLLSGYVLQIGDRVFDNSGRHALDQMMEGKPSLATLKTRVEDYKPAATSAEGGVVIASADGIVQVDGMDRAVYGEIVTFENGAKGHFSCPPYSLRGSMYLTASLNLPYVPIDFLYASFGSMPALMKSVILPRETNS